MNLNKVMTLLILTCILCSATLFAQSEFLDSRDSGNGGRLMIYSDGINPSGIRFDVSHSQSGILDIGISVSYRCNRGIAGDEKEYSLSVPFLFTVLKQEAFIPFSITIPGELSVTTMQSETLTNNELVKSGVSYRIGLEIVRFVPIHPRLYFEYGLTAYLSSGTNTTELESGVKSLEYPTSQIEWDVAYGVLAGATFRPKNPNHGLALSFDIRSYFHSENVLSFEASVYFTFVNAI
ncbi:hypothetical protein [uncultured Sphaerochaeta sp.]|uniref:hypothetical protein n=1 Tax=uncultured Sphaerochaeta sp. TaxID=886478 RepID=UPI002A0A7669|nr:hypothetical protein [uncultured Sphaerochaeta sp.]